MKKNPFVLRQEWIKLDENFTCVNQQQQNSRISHQSSMKIKAAQQLPSAQT